MRSLTAAIVVPLVLFSVACPANAAPRKKELHAATSANDPVLRNRIIALSPTIRLDEAERVAYCAYTTGREMAREWRVVWPPGVMNFLVNTGARKGGLCFQWATELLIRLDALKLETIELHWVESYARTISEHNVIVVTAKGQPYTEGILLDNWRYSGHLVWAPVLADPEYKWRENSAEAARRLEAAHAAASQPGRSSR
jgi:hypothetical protein